MLAINQVYKVTDILKARVLFYSVGRGGIQVRTALEPDPKVPTFGG